MRAASGREASEACVHLASSCCGGPALGTGTAWPRECAWRGSWGLTWSRWHWGGRGSASLVVRVPVHLCFRPACLGHRCAGPTCSLCSLLPGGHSSASRAPGAQAGRGSWLGPAPGVSVHPPCGTVTVLTPELRRACGKRAPTPGPLQVSAQPTPGPCGLALLRHSQEISPTWVMTSGLVKSSSRRPAPS